MNQTPEQEAREVIDEMLDQTGWAVQDLKAVNLQAKSGVAIRNFSLKPGHGLADYLLYVGGMAAGVIEAKKAGTTLNGVEIQSGKYTAGLPESLPAWYRPLPFGYESTGVETRFSPSTGYPVQVAAGKIEAVPPPGFVSARFSASIPC
jgi:type I restriction enzyme R subunit